MISLAVAGLLAAASVWTGVLRDTAVHSVRLFTGRVPEGVEPGTALVVCVGYWLVFLVALFSALFMAFLDIRYIKLQYAIEQQRLFQQSLGDELSSALLEKKRRDEA